LLLLDAIVDRKLGANIPLLAFPSEHVAILPRIFASHSADSRLVTNSFEQLIERTRLLDVANTLLQYPKQIAARFVHGGKAIPEIIAGLCIGD
jgi:hypothetical protein